MQGCTHKHIPGVLKDCQRRRALHKALLPLIRAMRLSPAAVSRLYDDFATTAAPRKVLYTRFGPLNRPRGAVDIEEDIEEDIDATDSEALDPTRSVNVPVSKWTLNGHIVERLDTVFWDDPKSYSSSPPRHHYTPERSTPIQDSDLPFKFGDDPKSSSSLPQLSYTVESMRSTPMPDSDLPLEFHMLEHEIENLTHPLLEMTRKERREAIDAFLRKHLPMDDDSNGMRKEFVAAPAKMVFIGRPNLKRRAENEVETRESKRMRSECVVQ